MNKRILWGGVLPLWVLVGLSNSPSQAQEPAPLPPGMDVQARGPVHEAFAQPTNSQPTPGPIIPRQPPAPIDELPPEQKPEGDNVQWIPGYWAWADDANNFIWVSGCWRAVPPGRTWIPGHWQEVEGGWVWVNGFWAPDNMNAIQYLPPPPPSIDQGPAAPAPNNTSFYVPGTWVYENNRYLWRPGGWVPFQPNWSWTAARYVWTPSGDVFVDGYWDYPFDQRGLLFAPVLFNLPAWLAARQQYVPQYVVPVDFLLGALFVGPVRQNFYFGDYFDPAYARRGFTSWVDYNPSPKAYDPTWAYYRHLNLANPRWEPALRELYSARRSGGIPRPPRTLTSQIQAINNLKNANVAVHKNVNLTHAQNLTAIAPLSKIHNTHLTNLGSLGGGKEVVPPRPIKLQNLQKEERARQQQAATQIRQMQQRRSEQETQLHHAGGVPVKHVDAPKSIKWETSKQPHVAPKVHPPPPITHPKHEERPIPKYDPPKPVAPPTKKP